MKRKIGADFRVLPEPSAMMSDNPPDRRAVWGGGDGHWIVPVALLVLCQYVAATIISHQIGFAGRPPIFKYMGIALVISLLGGSVILLPRLWLLWREMEGRPIARLTREVGANAIASYLIAFQLNALQLGALTWLKDMLPAVVPYWADPALASLDRALLGTDAWRLVPESLTRFFDIVYVTWAPVETITLFFILCLRPSAVKERAMVAFFLTVGLMGVCGQYLLSSAGPVFYDNLIGGDRFAGLLARIDAHAEFVKIGANMLWTSYSAHTDRIGNGISAMPSIHVATTAWVALSLSSLWPKLRAPAWGFWLLIFVGSFALGWHYFLDGVVGTAGALACWALAPRLLARTDGEVETGLAQAG